MVAGGGKIAGIFSLRDLCLHVGTVLAEGPQTLNYLDGTSRDRPPPGGATQNFAPLPIIPPHTPYSNMAVHHALLRHDSQNPPAISALQRDHGPILHRGGILNRQVVNV